MQKIPNSPYRITTHQTRKCLTCGSEHRGCDNYPGTAVVVSCEFCYGFSFENPLGHTVANLAFYNDEHYRVHEPNYEIISPRTAKEMIDIGLIKKINN